MAGMKGLLIVVTVVLLKLEWVSGFSKKVGRVSGTRTQNQSVRRDSRENAYFIEIYLKELP
jgi:hypothetical protein